MARTLAVVNAKGGVGKSAISINLSAALARRGQKVLLVDVDHQANASHGLGLRDPADYQRGTTYTAMMGEPTSDAIRTIGESLALLPGDIQLSSLDLQLANELGRERMLKDALEGVAKKFDTIVIDCPPALGVGTVNAICAAKEVFIPIDMSYFALTGLDLLFKFIDKARKRLNRGLVVRGIIPNRVDQRRSLDREILERVHDTHRELVSKVIIRQCQAIVDSTANGVPVIDYAPSSTAAVDFTALADEVLRA